MSPVQNRQRLLRIEFPQLFQFGDRFVEPFYID